MLYFGGRGRGCRRPCRPWQAAVARLLGEGGLITPAAALWRSYVRKENTNFWFHEWIFFSYFSLEQTVKGCLQKRRGRGGGGRRRPWLPPLLLFPSSSSSLFYEMTHFKVPTHKFPLVTIAPGFRFGCGQHHILTYSIDDRRTDGQMDGRKDSIRTKSNVIMLNPDRKKMPSCFESQNG